MTLNTASATLFSKGSLSQPYMYFIADVSAITMLSYAMFINWLLTNLLVAYGRSLELSLTIFPSALNPVDS